MNSEYLHAQTKYRKALNTIRANLPRKTAEEIILAIDDMLVVESRRPTQLPLDMNKEVVLGNQHHTAVDPKIDQPRLKTQYERILNYLLDKEWHTQYKMSEDLRIPQGSIGSQIRNARVSGWEIEKRRTAPNSGTWEYRLTGKKPNAEAAATN